MSFKKTYYTKRGYHPICRIGEGPLKKLEFGIIELDVGGSINYYTEKLETAFILLEGSGNLTVNGEKWENIGNRKLVFDNENTECFYIPCEEYCTIKALEHIKIAVCAALVDKKNAPFVVRNGKENLGYKVLIDESTNAVALTVGENFNENVIAADEEAIVYFNVNSAKTEAVFNIQSNDACESSVIANNELFVLPNGSSASLSVNGDKPYTLWLKAKVN